MSKRDVPSPLPKTLPAGTLYGDPLRPSSFYVDAVLVSNPDELPPWLKQAFPASAAGPFPFYATVGGYGSHVGRCNPGQVIWDDRERAVAAGHKAMMDFYIYGIRPRWVLR